MSRLGLLAPAPAALGPAPDPKPGDAPDPDAGNPSTWPAWTDAPALSLLDDGPRMGFPEWVRARADAYRSHGTPADDWLDEMAELAELVGAQSGGQYDGRVGALDRTHDMELIARGEALALAAGDQLPR